MKKHKRRMEEAEKQINFEFQSKIGETIQVHEKNLKKIKTMKII